MKKVSLILLFSFILLSCKEKDDEVVIFEKYFPEILNKSTYKMDCIVNDSVIVSPYPNQENEFKSTMEHYSKVYQKGDTGYANCFKYLSLHTDEHFNAQKHDSKQFKIEDFKVNGLYVYVSPIALNSTKDRAVMYHEIIKYSNQEVMCGRGFISFFKKENDNWIVEEVLYDYAKRGDLDDLPYISGIRGVKKFR